MLYFFLPLNIYLCLTRISICKKKKWQWWNKIHSVGITSSGVLGFCPGGDIARGNGPLLIHIKYQMVWPDGQKFGRNIIGYWWQGSLDKICVDTPSQISRICEIFVSCNCSWRNNFTEEDINNWIEKIMSSTDISQSVALAPSVFTSCVHEQSGLAGRMKVMQELSNMHFHSSQLIWLLPMLST